MALSRVSLALSVAALACNSPTPEARPDGSATSSTGTATSGGRPELVTPPKGTTDLAAFFKAERERGMRDGKKVVIYVGAPWCEPCNRFKEAVHDGLLDRELAGVRFLVTDLDVDGAALKAAGCDSSFVPLFSRPDADGKCTSKRAEGGIKGEGAVGYMLPRIKAILVGD